jgi:peptidoglycan/LPS O-acetylase OafA/YrhL
LVLAATAGFRLMAATWPAAPIIATILFATFYLWFFRVRWRAWRKARVVKRRAPNQDAPPDSD